MLRKVEMKLAEILVSLGEILEILIFDLEVLE
jgi:hypothetical protein